MRRAPTVYDHRPAPHNPEAEDSLYRPRRWARCDKCGGWVIRLTRATGPDYWQHRAKAWT